MARNVSLGHFDNAHGTYDISRGALNVTGFSVGGTLASDAESFHRGTRSMPTELFVAPDAALGGETLYVSLVPEPTSLTLVGLGAMGLLVRRRRAS